MKLHEVPPNTRIKVIGDIQTPVASPKICAGDELMFHDIDGMYSRCTKDGEAVYLVAWAEVEIIN
jgi:hypothetical protein